MPFNKKKKKKTKETNHISRVSFSGVVANVLNGKNRSKRVRAQSRYYVHFRAHTLGKGMNPLILLAMG